MSVNENLNIEELFPELQGILSQWETAPQAVNGFENENGVEPDAIEQAMQQRMAASPMPQFQAGQTAPPPPAPHVEDGGPPQAPPPPPQPEPQPSQAPEGYQPPQAPQPEPQQPSQPVAEPQEEMVTVGIDDQGQPITLPLSRVRGYYQFDEDFQNDPGLRQAVLNYYADRGIGAGAPTEQGTGRQTLPVGPVQPSPTPFPADPQVQPQQELDLDDPNVRYLLEQQQALSQQIQMLASGVQETQQQQQARAQAENDSMIRRAMTSFKEQRGLTDEQMESVRISAARLNVLPGLMQGVDPITGAPSKPDPLTALDRAFEIAYMMTPEHRQREFGREIQRRVEDSRRKQKLAGISGSSGSVPRTQPAPTTPQGRRAAMIDEIRQMQNGEWNPPEN